MKRCARCGDNKPLEQFIKRGNTRDGRGYYCRECNKVIQKEYVTRNLDRVRKSKTRYNNHDKTLVTIVYYLPEEHRVGLSNNLRRRLQKHRQNGLITDGVEILGKFERHVDAHYLETLLHMRGYHGYQYEK